MISAILAPLLSNGLSLVGNAVLAKGKEWVEGKTGIKLEEKMSDENILKLKQWEMEHEEELARIQLEENKIDAEVYKVEVQDRDSARDREVSINNSENATWMAKNTSGLIALSIVGLTFLLFGIAILGEFPTEKKDIIIYILGVLSGALTQILSYFFGSSKSSGAKDEALAKALGGSK